MRVRLAGALLLMSLFATAGVMSSVVTAQDESAFAGLDVPAIEVQFSEGTPEGVPAELEAGRYLVTFDNQSSSDIALNFIGLPEGLTFDQAMADAEAAGEDAPDWFYESSTPGGAVAPAGSSAESVINLAPGSYAVLVFAWEGPVDTGMPLQLEVSGDASALDDAPMPEADVVADMLDFEFVLSDPVPSGLGIWEITNSGEQPHEVALVRGPEGVTIDQVLAVAEADSTGGTPSADGPSADDFEPVGNTVSISAGQTTWVPFDLEPGTYVAFCFVPDPETGLPHMMLGMTTVFTVE
jgi:hypothetical protein